MATIDLPKEQCPSQGKDYYPEPSTTLKVRREKGTGP